jgi:hypothetical protein
MRLQRNDNTLAVDSAGVIRDKKRDRGRDLIHLDYAVRRIASPTLDPCLLDSNT